MEKVKGEVKLFEMTNPWHYLKVPKSVSENYLGKTFRGLFPITVTLGESIWDTSLLPFGDGEHFIALKARVRKKENIKVGDIIELTFIPRENY